MNEEQAMQLQEVQQAPPTPPEPEQATSKGQEKKPEGKSRLYTDADVDAIIERKMASWTQKKDAEVTQAQLLAEMNAQQKAEYERDQLKQQLASFQRKDTLHEMTKAARGMLCDTGLEVPDALLSVLVTEDAGKTKAAVESFAKLFGEAVERAVLEKVKAPPPKAGMGAPTMTKAQIMDIKDPEARQQAIKNNMQLFA